MSNAFGSPKAEGFQVAVIFNNMNSIYRLHRNAGTFDLIQLDDITENILGCHIVYYDFIDGI